MTVHSTENTLISRILDLLGNFEHTLIWVSVKSLDLILKVTMSSRAMGPTVQRMRVQRSESQSLISRLKE